MVAMLQSLVAQAVAGVQDKQACVAKEHVAQAKRDAEEAYQELHRQELALEQLKSRQAKLEAEREAQ